MARWALGLAFAVAGATAGAAAYPAVLRITRRDPGRGGALPEALFSHRTHGELGCYACHPSTFPQAAVGFTHDDMKKGLFCGRCHDGRTSFAIAGTACVRCHVPR